MTAYVVVNPKSATGREWKNIQPRLESIFPLMTVEISEARGQTATLVRQALQDGHINIVAVGGDGTLNEAVNGFFEQGVSISPDAVLGFVTQGGDFARSLGIAPGLDACLARLRKAHIRPIDVGRVSCLSLTGAPLARHFINAASFGLSGRIVRHANRSRLGQLLGRGFARRLHTLLSLMGWRSPRLRLIADHFDEIDGVTLVAVANGRWFGGGLDIAPEADPFDGFFDIAVMAGARRRRVIANLRGLRRGQSPPDMRVIRARRLTVAATVDTPGPVAIETDGESAGLLPATFEIFPGALNLRC